MSEPGSTVLDMSDNIRRETPATRLSDQAHALVRTFGANVMEIQAYPSERIGTVAARLNAAGLPWFPVNVDAHGVPRTLLCFEPEDFSQSRTSEYVEALVDGGINAYGYELFHDHEFVDIDLFQRVGPRLRSGKGPVFLRIYPTTTEDHTVVWLFGDPQALRPLVSLASTLGVEIIPAPGPEGVEALGVTLRGNRIQHQLSRLHTEVVGAVAALHTPWTETDDHAILNPTDLRTLGLTSLAWLRVPAQRAPVATDFIAQQGWACLTSDTPGADDGFITFVLRTDVGSPLQAVRRFSTDHPDDDITMDYVLDDNAGASWRFTVALRQGWGEAVPAAAETG